MNLDQIKFPDPYRSTEDAVGPGENLVVYDMKIGGGYVGFIDKVALNWYADCYWNWTVDGQLVEKVQRSIEMTEPDEYAPPIVAKKRIRFTFFNNSSSDKYPSVLCDGVLARRA